MREEWSESNQYRLLYFSPRPEDGEQVCVAVVARIGGRYLVEFDEKLSKMMSIARDRDVEFVRTILERLRYDLNGHDLSKMVESLQPQFSLSEPRRLLVEWSEDVRTRLRRRFLLRGRQSLGPMEHEHQKQVQTKLRTLMAEIVPGAEDNFVSELKPDQLFGDRFAKAFRNPKPITRALIGRTRAVLIDGVDTTVGTSTDVIQRTNRIAFTFWQYGRVAQDPSLPVRHHRQIIRVGVVFDQEPRTRTVRDYSLHQFTKDADFAIEVGVPEGIESVRNEIQKTLQDIKI